MLTPAEIAEAQRLCEVATPGPWDYDEIMMPFYNDPEGNSRGGLGAGFWEVWADDPSEPDGDPIMLVDRTTKGNAAFIAAARSLLPKALAHLQAQAEQLRQAQAAGIIMREALLDVDAVHQSVLGHSNERGDPLTPIEVFGRVVAALSSTPTITAYAARVARMEAALREIAEESPVRLDGWVRNRALAALEGDG